MLGDVWQKHKENHQLVKGVEAEEPVRTESNSGWSCWVAPFTMSAYSPTKLEVEL